MIESSPWANVVYSSPCEATTPSSTPASPPACRRTRSPTRNGWAEISTSPAITLPSVCCAARPNTTAKTALLTAIVRLLTPIRLATQASVTTSRVSRMTNPVVPAVAGSSRRCRYGMTDRTTSRASRQPRNRITRAAA